MKAKTVLAAYLLAVGLCFVPALGYGEITKWMHEREVSYVDYHLLKARLDYMMYNPGMPLAFSAFYDPDGGYARAWELPKGISTKGKICVSIRDIKGMLFRSSGIALLDEFKRHSKAIFGWIVVPTRITDANTDIVAMFTSREGIPLGYFYQGEYYLWEK